MEETFDYTISKASNFSKEDIVRFKKLVIDAGQVSESTFNGLVDKDPMLLFIPNTLKIEAVGALKIPNDDYKQKVFTKSKSSENLIDFNFELGWVVNLKPGNGNGKKIVEILSSIHTNIYATVRQENKKMKHILEKYGFAKSGNSYKSERGDYDIELYIKNIATQS